MDFHVVKNYISHSHSANGGLELVLVKHKPATKAIKKLLVAPGESEPPSPKSFGVECNANTLSSAVWPSNGLGCHAHPGITRA